MRARARASERAANGPPLTDARAPLRPFPPLHHHTHKQGFWAGGREDAARAAAIAAERIEERRAREEAERARPGAGADSHDSHDSHEEATLPFDEAVDYYAVLGLDRAATAREVQRAYKRLALL